MRVLAAVAVLTAAGCSSIATSYDYDPEADFARLSTWAWQRPTPPDELDELVRRRVERAVRGALEAKGYREVADSPDFRVAIHGRQDTEVRVDDWGYDPSPYGWRRGGRIDVRQVEKGTLILDFLDGSTGRLIWRGTATATIRANPTPEQQTERIDDAVGRVLASFPPPG